MDYSNNNKYGSQNPNNNKNNSEDGDTDDLDNSQHLDDLMSDKIVDHEDQVILTKKSYNINIPITRLFLQCLYEMQGLSLRYLHKTIITILCLFCIYEITSTGEHILSSLRIPLQMSLREDILHHLYEDISTSIFILF